MPEDRAKLHALWAHRSEHCGKCGQHRPSWFDENGKALRDPPFDIDHVFCPACALFAEYEDEVKDQPRLSGEHPYWARVDYDDESDADAESAA